MSDERDDALRALEVEPEAEGRTCTKCGGRWPRIYVLCPRCEEPLEGDAGAAPSRQGR